VLNGTLNRQQVRALYEQHGRVLLAYAFTLLPDRSSSEDVLHQVFVRLLQGGVTISGPPAHYLYRAVRNTALNYRRSHAREIELPADGRWLESPPGMGDVGLALETALKELPQEQREVIVLRVWGQMTFEEAAAALEISTNTAASRYRYGLAKLRERLKPLAAQE
jgi:RNA polymerase sigma-70 factor (ECF subfamily)